MLMDSQEIFSTAQAVTSTGDTASTNVLDTGAAQDEGIGEPVWLTCLCTTTATSGGSATLAAVLQTSSDNSTYTDAIVGPVVALAGLTAKAVLLQTRLPVGLKRYLRIAWRVATAALTAGNFSAFLTKDVQAYQYGASGFSVS